MLRLAADENFNANIVRGLRLRFPSIDLVRVQDIGLSGTDDPAVLAWAAREGRILLTHDVTTLVDQRFTRWNHVLGWLQSVRAVSRARR